MRETRAAKVSRASQYPDHEPTENLQRSRRNLPRTRQASDVVRGDPTAVLWLRRNARLFRRRACAAKTPRTVRVGQAMTEYATTMGSYLS